MSQIAWVSSAAAVIGFLVAWVKSDKFPLDLPARWRPTFALVLGAVAAVVDALAMGTPWQMALQNGLNASALSTLGHGVIVEGLANGREILPKVAAVAEKAAPILAFAAVLGLATGCGATKAQILGAIDESAAVAGEAAVPVIEKMCIEPMEIARAKDDRAAGLAIAEKCDPVVEAFDVLRLTRAMLRAGIVALAGGLQPADLEALGARVSEAGAKLAVALGGLTK